MSTRTLEKLRRDQAALANELRWLSIRVGEGLPASLASAPAPVILWGRVTEVVTSHVEYGPHLMVQPQAFSGVPPTPSDTSGAEVRCYPSPGRVVADYSVAEYVKVLTCRGGVGGG